MRKILPLCLLAMVPAFAFPQMKKIAESAMFPETEDGFGRILQLKNGYTMLIVFPFRRGVDVPAIDIKIYDAKHKPKVSKRLVPKYGKLDHNGGIEAIFESNGDAVLLVNDINKRTPTLHRVVIDGVKGIFKKQDVIATIPEVTVGKAFALGFGGVPGPGFYVHKDPNSDLYAVTTLNSMTPDRNKRLEVALYNGEHEEISRGFYHSPEDKYKYLEYIDMAVVDQTVHVLGYAYNTRRSGGKENIMVLGTLVKGDTSVDVKELDFTHDLELDRGLLKYNPATEKLMMLVYVTKSKGVNPKGYTRLIYIDPATRTQLAADDIFPEEADIKSRELFGRKADYEGRPVNFFLNADGSFAVVYEDLGVRIWQSSTIAGSTGTSLSGGTRMNTELKDLAVSMYDANGKIIKSYFLPKRHYLWGGQPRAFYHAHRAGRATRLYKGDQYKSFAFINGKDKKILLFNDVEENTKRVLKGKITTIMGVGECDAFYFLLEGEEVLPKREYVYGDAVKRKDHNLGLFAVGDYDPVNNLYVTIKADAEQKNIRLIWMEP
ncbi:hypothetical protein ACFOTA_17565 [Chitinophaga sp. GCM10012297]|uniref:Arylsulfotransferase (ASST) n=1 Tax=Chitinophaga chungangae TaxID=2821488 RepID=A0ABS3YH73_9BACT|nr:hypothetical protein [Chitinophaga chungangae]MBO9154031.1 hypothetical protein [Chitinophaga chungangae]